MAKSTNQKLKLLYIVKILSEHTDEEHRMSTQELIDRLAAYDVTAERKSVYSDIGQLVLYGYDIIYSRSGTSAGYYMAGREFELPELKLLVDAVQASRFITLKKSRELIAKIERLAGKYEAGQLRRQVYVAGRIKTENESIYYIVDHIHRAIQENKMISFCYLEWTAQKEQKQRHGGARYLVSPWALTWKDENYYLIAYDSNVGQIRHYRVDKMDATAVEGRQSREGGDAFEKLDIVSYTNHTFGMFGGTDVTVAMKLPERMTGIFIDRFGKEIDIRKTEDGYLSARIRVVVSEQFFGWVAGLGNEVMIVSPMEVRSRFVSYLMQIVGRYEE